MSDPKTSPSKPIAFHDRLAVIGNASFICLAVSVIWTALFIGKAQVSTATLLFLAAPLISTGITVVIGSFAKDLVPKPVLSTPLNFTVPLIWCLVCFLTVFLISTQETGSARVPEALMPALAWSKLSNLIPVFIGQVIALSLVLVFVKQVD